MEIDFLKLIFSYFCPSTTEQIALSSNNDTLTQAHQ